ncbi:MAG: phenylacetate--CoA ligase family protein [Gammaproteobacteria bacterium]
MSDLAFATRSAVAGEHWPGLPSPRGAMLAALLYQFERDEWLSAAVLQDRQFTQIQRLLGHALDTVPYYRERRSHYPDPTAAIDAAGWSGLPVLTRRTIQTAGERLHSEAVPPEMGKVYRAETSGSTGEPVRLYRTELDRLLWEALTLREHYWHERDFGAKLASIRVLEHGQGAPPEGTLLPCWGGPASELHDTGPLALLALDTDIEIQVPWLQRQDPDYLLTYPTNLAALLDHAERHGWTLPHLRVIRSVGETLPEALRERCRALWGLEIADLYSSREIGYLALQCPLSGLYHITAETVLVEVLDADGRAVEPGGVGRLVVTALHNYATPLLRYELNDYAEVGPPCPCGRGLPTLRRILGRTRNMVVFPDGRRHWPLVGFGRFRDVAPIRQYQLVQTTPERITVRLVVDRPLVAAEESAMTEIIHSALGHPFTLDFDYVASALPRGPGGKFEEFVSRVT